MGHERFVLGVDLDGVVADFYAGLREIAAEWTGRPLSDLPIEVTYDLKEWDLKEFGGYEALHRFAIVERHLFEKLKPLAGAPAVLRKLSARDIRIRVITHRLFIKWFHVEAVQQTTQWLEHHGIPYWDLCFVKDKTEVGADVYLEDSPANIESLRQSGNKVIVVTNSTNRHIPGSRADTWQDIEAQVMKEFAAWKASR